MDNNTQNGQNGQTGKTHSEEFRISSDELVSKFKQLVSEGNVRKVSIRTEEGRTLFELPLNMGVAGAAATLLFAPALAALGAIAALVSHVTISIERSE